MSLPSLSALSIGMDEARSSKSAPIEEEDDRLNAVIYATRSKRAGMSAQQRTDAARDEVLRELPELIVEKLLNTDGPIARDYQNAVAEGWDMDEFPDILDFPAPVVPRTANEICGVVQTWCATNTQLCSSDAAWAAALGAFGVRTPEHRMQLSQLFFKQRLRTPLSNEVLFRELCVHIENRANNQARLIGNIRNRQGDLIRRRAFGDTNFHTNTTNLGSRLMAFLDANVPGHAPLQINEEKLEEYIAEFGAPWDKYLTKLYRWEQALMVVQARPGQTQALKNAAYKYWNIYGPNPIELHTWLERGENADLKDNVWKTLAIINGAAVDGLGAVVINPLTFAFPHGHPPRAPSAMRFPDRWDPEVFALFDLPLQQKRLFLDSLGEEVRWIEHVWNETYIYANSEEKSEWHASNWD